MEKLLKLRPAFKDYLWGGTHLKTKYHKQSAMPIVAESWELSCHPDGMSTIVNGTFAGRTLEAFLQCNPTALGTHVRSRDKFPILAKFIDAAKDLSVQVHPDDAYAQQVEGEFGKNEMWYVLDAQPGAALIFGFRDGVSREDYQKSIQDGTVLQVLHTVPVQKGDYFFIPAGMMHGIGAGITIAEIQQNSNATYRVYDYDRTDAHGNKRPLHTQKALDVLRFDKLEQAEILYGTCAKQSSNSIVPLCNSRYFNTNYIRCAGLLDFGVLARSFHHLLVLEGCGQVRCGEELLFVSKGDSVFISAHADFYSVSGNLEFLQTYL